MYDKLAVFAIIISVVVFMLACKRRGEYFGKLYSQDFNRRLNRLNYKIGFWPSNKQRRLSNRLLSTCFPLFILRFAKNIGRQETENLSFPIRTR